AASRTPRRAVRRRVANVSLESPLCDGPTGNGCSRSWRGRKRGAARCYALAKGRVWRRRNYPVKRVPPHRRFWLAQRSDEGAIHGLRPKTAAALDLLERRPAGEGRPVGTRGGE